MFERLRKRSLGYPGATEDHPWGETAIKVNGKVFVFLGEDGMSVKLPQSRDIAHDLPFTEPTHYGLGKHGWVSLTFDSGDELPMEQLKKWIDESFRAVAPKTLVKKMDGVTAPVMRKTKK